MVLTASEVIQQKSASVLNSKYRYQLLAAITVQLVTFSHGVATGWLSPTIFKLESDHPPTSFMITVENISWIGSLYGLGSLAGNITFGLLLNRIGRKPCMYLLAVPYIIMWFLIYFAQNYIYLCAARFLGGITGGGNYVVVPIFISEIAHPSVRGALTSMAMFNLSFGMLLGFVIATYFNYYVIPIIALVFPVVYLVAVTYFPETPHFLLRKNKVNKARDSYGFYHNLQVAPQQSPTNNSYNGSQQKYANDCGLEIESNTKEIRNNDLPGFDELMSNILNKEGTTDKLNRNDFFNREAGAAILTALVLIFTNQFSGTFALMNYMSDIFHKSGTQIDPNICTMVMGFVQIIGTLSSMVLVDRFGRRVLMLSSCWGMAIGFISFGILSHFALDFIRVKCNWLPLVIMAIIIYMSSIGMVALLFTVIVEVLPAKVRAPLTSVCMAILSLLVFVTLKLFPLILDEYGLSYLLIGCGGACVIGAIYLGIFLKETKGKSLDK